MQPKASIVIPCHNKATWISDMFDSVVAQKWDNIEIILVNDGSTDGTRDVIEAYVSRFTARGFETVIIDQDNQGVAAAVYAGLMQISGAFVCVPDCDDVLLPEYVSAMVERLLTHPEDNWITCDIHTHFWYPSSSWLNSLPEVAVKYPYRVLESLILCRVLASVHCYMIRVSFLLSSGVLDNFHVSSRISQEPQIWAPLALTGERPVHMRKSLYKHCPREASVMQSLQTSEKTKHWIEQYYELVKKSITAHKTLSAYDIALIDIGCLIFQHSFICVFPQYDDIEMTGRLLETINRNGLSDSAIFGYKSESGGFFPLSRYISNRLIGYVPCPIRITRRGRGRIIAYAAFGRAARGIETGLCNSGVRPDVYWDINARESSEIDGIPVIKPEFDSLCGDDTLLLLLKNPAIISDVIQQLKAAPALANYWHYDDVADFLTEHYFS